MAAIGMMSSAAAASLAQAAASAVTRLQWPCCAPDAGHPEVTGVRSRPRCAHGACPARSTSPERAHHVACGSCGGCHVRGGSASRGSYRLVSLFGSCVSRPYSQPAAADSGAHGSASRYCSGHACSATHSGSSHIVPPGTRTFISTLNSPHSSPPLVTKGCVCCGMSLGMFVG